MSDGTPHSNRYLIVQLFWPLIIIGSFILISLSSSIYSDVFLLMHGERTQGVIINISSAGLPSVFDYTVQFTDTQGHQILFTQGNSYTDLRVGAFVPVRYDPSHEYGDGSIAFGYASIDSLGFLPDWATSIVFGFGVAMLVAAGILRWKRNRLEGVYFTLYDGDKKKHES